METKIFVIRDGGGWSLRVGESRSRTYRSETEAIQSAFKRARALGQAGLEAQVVMRMLTCSFGPNGMKKTEPTRSVSSAG